MTTPRARNPRGRGDQLRAELLAAAAALLDEHGDPAAVTVRGVAATVGVAPNAVYLHFANRDALLVAAVTERFATFTAALVEILDGTAAPLDQLRAGHGAYMAFARANPGVYRAMFGGQSLDPGNDALAGALAASAYPAFEALLTIVDRCRSAGVLPAGIGREAFARLLFAAEHGWTDLATSSRGTILPAEDDLLDTLLVLAGHPLPPA